MSWFIAIFIGIYTIISMLSIFVCNEDYLFDFHWNEYDLFQKIMLVVSLINLGFIFILILYAYVYVIHSILVQIP